jgi:hypothetical protein
MAKKNGPVQRSKTRLAKSGYTLPADVVKKLQIAVAGDRDTSQSVIVQAALDHFFDLPASERSAVIERAKTRRPPARRRALVLD